MAITTIGSYVTTADAFIAHGTDVNVDRLANSLPEMVMKGGYTIGNLTTSRDELDAKITALVGLENAIEEAIDDRDLQKQNIRDRLRQFRLAVRLNFKDSTYFKRVPTLPPKRAVESKFLRRFDDMADMWARINADDTIPGFTPPLLLTGGYTLGGFKADLLALRVGYRAVAEAENDEDMARKERDGMLDPLRERMLQYRAAIELEYGPGHPFTQSLPDITPARRNSSASGSDPDPIVASGFWDVTSGEGVINWSDSTDADLDHYSVRMSPGASYDPVTATVVGTIPAGTTELRTTDGLASSSDVAAFQVFVVLTTANEAGSNTVVITRP